MVIEQLTELRLGEGDRMTIDNELIDNLLKDYKKPEDLIGENGLLKQLTKQLLERAMAAEMTAHVGYEKHDAAGNNSGQLAEWDVGEDDQGKLWHDADRSAAGSERDLRAADHREASDALHGFRRKHHFAVCARIIDAGDPAAPGRNLPRGSIAGIDFERDR